MLYTKTNKIRRTIVKFTIVLFSCKKLIKSIEFEGKYATI
ncbi:hypothetical protein HMPREF3217_00479 [Finegoldia magna]|nr:hypothetical protein HMPREF3217_00479 [Finegoldia magna]